MLSIEATPVRDMRVVGGGEVLTHVTEHSLGGRGCGYVYSGTVYSSPWHDSRQIA